MYHIILIHRVQNPFNFVFYPRQNKLVHRVQTMPRYSTYVNKEEDKILIEYGRILVKEGHIEAPFNRYKLIKFIINKLIKTFRDKSSLLNQPGAPINPAEEKKTS